MTHKVTASVSVVIPCFCCSDTIERAVKSIYEQTLIPHEVILVEDFSDDNTLEKLYELQVVYGESWIKVIALKENVGPGSARNIGWDLSNQDYIAFLDSDDSWHPNKIEIQYNWMIKNQEVAISGHNCNHVDFGTSKFIPSANLEFNFNKIKTSKMLLSNLLFTPSVMLKRSLPFRFESNKRYAEDYQLWMEIMLHGNQCYKSQQELAYLYKAPYGESGLSSDLWKMEKGELAAYKYLYNKRLLKVNMLPFFYLWSLIKYIKRLIK